MAKTIFANGTVLEPSVMTAIVGTDESTGGIHDGANADGHYAKIDLTAHVTGQLPLANMAKQIPIGAIVAYCSGLFIPSGYLLCDGQAVNQGTYPTLYGLITHVPDLRGRFVVGADQMPQGITTWSFGTTYAINAVVYHNGQYFISLQNSNSGHDPDERLDFWKWYPMPDDVGGLSRVGLAVSELPLVDNNIFSSGSWNGMTSGGSALPHENRPPFYALVYIIRAL